MRECSIKENAKLYIIITGAIASGKTTLALNLARAVPNCFYLDKDDLGPMAEKIFEVGQEETYDRQSDFFRRHVRDVEYDVAEIMGLRGLLFNQHVIINTPYTGEIRHEFSGRQSNRLRRLHDQVRRRGGELMVIYIDIDKETAMYRLNKRKNEDPAAALRTPHIYENIEAFLDKQNLSIPEDASVLNADHFFVYHAADPETSYAELMDVMHIRTHTAYDPEISQAPFMGAVRPTPLTGI